MSKRREFVTRTAAIAAASLLPAAKIALATEALDFREVAFADGLSRQKFELLVNQTFHVTSEADGVLAMELTEVTEREYRKVRPTDLDQFTLTFRGPVAPAIPEGLYQVEHWLAGTLLLNLAPTGDQQYKAAFSLLRQ